MESIGNKLQSARAAKGVTVEQAVRDTHMTKRFIEAMEAEDFDQFPGEAYLLGFLRTYASYLGLEGEEVITLYHNIKLQEQPAPIDELLDRKRRAPIPVKVLLLIFLLVLLGGVVALFLTGALTFPELPRRSSRVEVTDERELFTLQEQFVERRFAQGDRIAVPVDGEEAILEFVEIGERVAFGSEAGIVHLGQGERRLLDLTGEGSGDVNVSVRQIYLSDEDPPVAVVRIDRVLSPDPVDEPATAGVITERERADLALGQTNQPERRRDPEVIARFASLEEYFLEVDFRGRTLFRWEVDDQPREERFVQNGDLLRTSVENMVRLWASNAGNVRLRVAGNPVNLGDQGEVVTAVIRWSDATDGGYQLELLPQY
jgi:cytoskeleton protein RodZ